MSANIRPDSAEPPEGGFLSRWSRRKSQARQPGDAPAITTSVALTAPMPVSGVATPATAGSAATHSGSAPPAEGAGAAVAVPSRAAEPAAPPPTLEDVAQLDADSDYRRFAARDVDPSVRNAAMKKLFHSDPHFNVMDGLDVYIDDYNAVAPLPKAMLRNLLQARTLGLIDDELKEQERPEDLLPPPHPAAVEVQGLGTEGAQSLAPVERSEDLPAQRGAGTPGDLSLAPTAEPADPETPPLPMAHPGSAGPA